MAFSYDRLEYRMLSFIGLLQVMCVHLSIHVWVFAKAAYLLIIWLQYMVEPGDLSQFAQFQLQTLQGIGQLLLLWRVQLLQGRIHKARTTTVLKSEVVLMNSGRMKRVFLCKHKLYKHLFVPLLEMSSSLSADREDNSQISEGSNCHCCL